MRMIKGNKKTSNHKNTITLFLFVAILLSLCAFGLYIRYANTFVYEDSLDETVISIDGEPVSLREFGYYILSLEEFVNAQAIQYDASNPIAYWNAHFRAGIQSTFVSALAKKKAFEACECDMIYYKMATEKGYCLDESELEKAQLLSDEFWKKQSEEVVSITGISREMVQEIFRKKVLIAKFAKDYVKTIDFEGYSGYREHLISSGGAYYEKEILPKHEVKRNKRIEAGLKFGRITINKKKEL